MKTNIVLAIDPQLIDVTNENALTQLRLLLDGYESDDVVITTHTNPRSTIVGDKVKLNYDVALRLNPLGIGVPTLDRSTRSLYLSRSPKDVFRRWLIQAHDDIMEDLEELEVIDCYSEMHVWNVDTIHGTYHVPHGVYMMKKTMSARSTTIREIDARESTLGALVSSLVSSIKMNQRTLDPELTSEQAWVYLVPETIRQYIRLLPGEEKRHGESIGRVLEAIGDMSQFVIERKDTPLAEFRLIRTAEGKCQYIMRELVDGMKIHPKNFAVYQYDTLQQALENVMFGPNVTDPSNLAKRMDIAINAVLKHLPCTSIRSYDVYVTHEGQFGFYESSEQFGIKTPDTQFIIEGMVYDVLATLKELDQ